MLSIKEIFQEFATFEDPISLTFDLFEAIRSLNENFNSHSIFNFYQILTFLNDFFLSSNFVNFPIAISSELIEILSNILSQSPLSTITQILFSFLSNMASLQFNFPLSSLSLLSQMSMEYPFEAIPIISKIMFENKSACYLIFSEFRFETLLENLIFF